MPVLRSVKSGIGSKINRVCARGEVIFFWEGGGVMSRKICFDATKPFTILVSKKGVRECQM